VEKLKILVPYELYEITGDPYVYVDVQVAVLVPSVFSLTCAAITTVSPFTKADGETVIVQVVELCGIVQVPRDVEPPSLYKVNVNVLVVVLLDRVTTMFESVPSTCRVLWFAPVAVAAFAATAFNGQ